MSVASINYNEGKTMQIELQQFPPGAAFFPVCLLL